MENKKTQKEIEKLKMENKKIKKDLARLEKIVNKIDLQLRCFSGSI